MKIYRLGESGKEQRVRILQPADFLCERALFGDKSQNNYAEILEPTELCLIPGRDLKKLPGQFPEIAIKILEDLSVRFEMTEKYVEQPNQRSVNQHLSVLLELSVNGEKKIPSLKLLCV